MENTSFSTNKLIVGCINDMISRTSDLFREKRLTGKIHYSPFLIADILKRSGYEVTIRECPCCIIVQNQLPNMEIMVKIDDKYVSFDIIRTIAKSIKQQRESQVESQEDASHNDTSIEQYKAIREKLYNQYTSTVNNDLYSMPSSIYTLYCTICDEYVSNLIEYRKYYRIYKE
jgi:hypothetical protein